MLALYVPKRLFTHLYGFGICMSLISYTSLYVCFGAVDPSHQALMLLWSMHLMRRLMECIFITEFGTSRMHVCGFLVGLLHYTLVPLTLFNMGSVSLTASFWKPIVAMPLFILSSAAQFFSHRHLYHLKRRGKYSLPSSGLFCLVSCPHYTAEIVIYSALAILGSGRLCLIAMVLWVVSNLVVVSVRQHAFYSIKFKDEIPAQWNKLIPGVF